ncbi:MAG TPA: hypothetical protein VF867_14295 [Arthrobacter sp.]
MKATLKKISQSRSLQRRWALTEAPPVHSYLNRERTFIPADLRIWWCAGAGQPMAEHTLHIYAWPAERDDHLTATWRNGYNHDPIPGWITDLSDVVHEDLIANATSTNAGFEDRWDYSVDRGWTLEGAPPVRSAQHASKLFVPADLNVWHSHTPGDTKNDRHRITAYPADRTSQVYADWGGGVDWEGNPRYSADLPGWIRTMAEEQYAQLVAFATQSESERGTR